MMRQTRLFLIAVILASMAQGTARAAEITVFAAASLKTALDAIAADWQSATGNRVQISYGGSSTLARQIVQGAPADLFIPAATDWMDYLQSEGLIRMESRVDLLGNTLVLIAHGDHAGRVVDKGLDIATMLDGGRLAMAMVDSVPAGQYGKEALIALGLWPSVQASVVQSENVRAALALVASGEAPYGVVFGSDAIADDGADDNVSVVGVFPETSHRPIIYSAALTITARLPLAQDFLTHLTTDLADTTFSRHGFIPLD